MARPAKPWYRKDRDAWYVEIDGRQRKLADGKSSQTEAYRRYLELKPDPKNPTTARLTSKEVAGLFLKHAKANLKPKTHRWYAMFLDRFTATIGHMDANEIKPMHITDFLDDNPQWNPTSRRGAITSIKRAWNWAHEEGRITLNQIAKVKRPRALKREDILDERECLLYIKSAKEPLNEFLEFIYETGCRPGEAAMIEPRHFKLAFHEVRFRIGEDKTSGKTGKPRVIQLTPRAEEILVGLSKRVKTGTLFRNSRDNKWTEYAIDLAARKARDRAGLDERAVPYTLRHRWATDALARGVSVEVVAEMMGSSVEVVLRTYCHLSDHKDLLLAAAKKARPHRTT
ncbi:MAG: tyrosine-type recombinase/integrase [Isosphaeraceae bacterium]|nr:tyrosine-type recombinase/integrase [Isosphaeraceae bacterium]